MTLAKNTSKLKKAEIQNNPQQQLKKLKDKSSNAESKSIKSKSSNKSLLKPNKKLNISDDSILMSDEELLKIYEQKSTKETINKEVKSINSKLKEQKKEELETIKEFNNEPFKNQRIVITGVFNSSPDREQLSQLLKSLGATITQSISGQTNLLLIGNILEDGRPVTESNKYKQSQQRGIQTLNENQLNDYLIQTTNQTLQEWLQKTHNQIFQNKSEKKIQIIQNVVQHQKQEDKKPEINILWVDKYKPLTSQQIIGQQDNISKMKQWLIDWSNKSNSGNAWMKEKSKCLLISGPPGIGKTTAINLICKELNYNLIVQNASDNWSKQSLAEFMNCYSQGNASLENFFAKKSTNVVQRKNVILMDEVDGITSDKGGIQELVYQIKNTSNPIICICNDREKPQIKTLSQYCYEIKFQQIPVEDLYTYIEYIVKQELDENSWNLLNKQSLNSIIINSQFDIRQILGQLQVWLQSINHSKNEQLLNSKDSDMNLNVYEACKWLLNSKKNSQTKIKDLMKLFFVNYQLIDFYIFENYLSRVTYQDNQLAKTLESIQSICQGEKTNQIIMKTQQYDLLPIFAWQSVISPSLFLNRHLDFPQFPIMLGKMSSKNKHLRQYAQFSRLFFNQAGQCCYQDLVLICMIVFQQFNSQLQSENYHNVFDLLNSFNLDTVIIQEELTNFIEFYDLFEMSKSIDKKQTKKFEQFQSKQGISKGSKKTKSSKLIQSQSEIETEEVEDEQADQSIRDYAMEDFD